jgi:hypothetical protein
VPLAASVRLVRAGAHPGDRGAPGLALEVAVVGDGDAIENVGVEHWATPFSLTCAANASIGKNEDKSNDYFS